MSFQTQQLAGKEARSVGKEVCAFSRCYALDAYGALAVRRECRGLLLHPVTGQVLARRFHKFFNVNELEETTGDRLQVTFQYCAR